MRMKKFLGILIVTCILMVSSKAIAFDLVLLADLDDGCVVRYSISDYSLSTNGEIVRVSYTLANNNSTGTIDFALYGDKVNLQIMALSFETQNRENGYVNLLNNLKYIDYN